MTESTVVRRFHRSIRTTLASWMLPGIVSCAITSNYAVAVEPQAASRDWKAAFATALRAKAEYDAKQFSAAAQSYLKAFQGDPSRTDWVYSAARSYEKGRMFEEAALHYAAFVTAPGNYADKLKKAQSHAADVQRERTESGRYQIDTSGRTVVDRTTGLTWERGADTQPKEWPGAKARCDQLAATAGNWRLPTRDELQALIPVGSTAGINSRVFPNTRRDWHWSSTTDSQVDPADIFAVNFDTGESRSGSVDSTLYARCVHAPSQPAVSTAPARPTTNSPAPGPQQSKSGPYRINAEAGIVLDTRTGWTWQRTTDGNYYIWKESNSYCRSLQLAGGGWRLPSKNELELLLVEGKRPTIDQIAFPDTPGDWFWTSTQHGSSADAWYVHFYNGKSGERGITYSSRVRCVR